MDQRAAYQLVVKVYLCTKYTDRVAAINHLKQYTYRYTAVNIMGFTRILSTKLRSKKKKKKKELNDDETTTNHSKTNSTLLRSVSLGSGFMPSSGTITPPLTPIDDDDDDVEELAVDVDTFNKKQKTASFLSGDGSTKSPNRSVLLRISGKTTHDDRLPHDFGDEVCVYRHRFDDILCVTL